MQFDSISIGSLFIILCINIYKISYVNERILQFRDLTNNMFYSSNNFIKNHDPKSKLFIGASSFPSHEHLAWGSDIIVNLLLDQNRITNNYMDASHVMWDYSKTSKIDTTYPRTGYGQFSINFGIWMDKTSIPELKLELFQGLRDDEKWFIELQFLPTKKSTVDKFRTCYLTFRVLNNKDEFVIFLSDPFTIVWNEMNQINFGRDRNIFFVVKNRKLIQKQLDKTDIDFSHLNLSYGPWYKNKNQHRPKGFFAHTLIQIGYVPLSILENPINHIFNEINYSKHNFLRKHSIL